MGWKNEMSRRTVSRQKIKVTEAGNLRADLAAMAARNAGRFSKGVPHSAGRVAFVENKRVNFGYVAELLAHCAECNQWANRGPLYWTLAEAFHDHMGLGSAVTVTPCANGGIALEAQARFLEQRAGRRLRWAGSAFSFANLARGWFTDMRLVDCDDTGMLNLAALEALNPAEYDGFVVTNIFGLWNDFNAYIDFARSRAKLMLIDNAAGIGRSVPDWPYQSFSLHHTKPYGAGEGGLFISPRDEAEEIYALLNYGSVEPGGAALWLNNGKLSDLACAFHLDRLASETDWARRYGEQAERVDEIAQGLGLTPLVPGPLSRPTTSRAYVAPEEIPIDRLRREGKLQFGKYYKPLSDQPLTKAIYSRLVNIPTHPDVVSLSDDELQAEILDLISEDASHA